MTIVRKRVVWIIAAVLLLGWPWLTEDRFFHHVGRCAMRSENVMSALGLTCFGPPFCS